MNKKGMSVTEMRLLLGIGKIDPYWLVKKGYPETVIIAGKVCVIVDNFEEWHGNQLRYRRLTALPQGRAERASHLLFGKRQSCFAFLIAAFTSC